MGSGEETAAETGTAAAKADVEMMEVPAAVFGGLTEAAEGEPMGAKARFAAKRK